MDPIHAEDAHPAASYYTHPSRHCRLHSCPGPFSDETAAYVTAFSAMLLNTDLHNPNVRRKMTLEQFVSNNRGINNGKNLPDEMLQAVVKVVWRDVAL